MCGALLFTGDPQRRGSRTRSPLVAMPWKKLLKRGGWCSTLKGLPGGGYRADLRVPGDRARPIGRDSEGQVIQCENFPIMTETK